MRAASLAPKQGGHVAVKKKRSILHFVPLVIAFAVTFRLDFDAHNVGILNYLQLAVLVYSFILASKMLPDGRIVQTTSFLIIGVLILNSAYWIAMDLYNFILGLRA
jgi:hypothetical protein